VVAVGTFSAYVLESDNADSRISDLGDAFCWALATITSVGYGDVAPVTALGRAVDAFLIKTATPKAPTDEVKEAIKKKAGNTENHT
jgi:hypothetical protein